MALFALLVWSVSFSLLQAEEEILFSPGTTIQGRLSTSVFREGDPVVIPVKIWKDGVAGISAFSPDQIGGRVFEFWGNTVGEITVERDPETKQLIVRSKVAGLGWYRIQFYGKSVAAGYRFRRAIGDPRSMESYDYLQFAIVPKPHTREAVHDSPFGVDIAVSALGIHPVSAQIELAHLTGCRWVRDRFDWAKLNPEEANILWGGRMDIDRELDRRGMNVLQVIQGAPSWTKSHPERSFPTDLRAAFDTAQRLVGAAGDTVKAWEVWNEPDIAHFSKDTPDQYAALLKAMSLGFKRTKGFTPLVHLAPFARHPDVGGFAEVLRENDVAKYADTYAYHTYHPFTKNLFDRVLATHTEVAHHLGFQRNAVWLTETGHVYARRSGNKVTESPAEQVSYLLRAYTTALSGGIARVFYFLSRPHFEGSFQHGLVDSTLSPFPAYVALSVLTNQLGRGEYSGRLPLAVGEAYLFSDGPRVTAVVFPNEQGQFSLPPLGSNVKATTVMGGEFALDRQAEESVIYKSTFPIYVSDVSETLSPLSIQPPTIKPQQKQNQKVSGVVLRVEIPQDKIALDASEMQEYWDGVATNWAPRGYHYRGGETVAANIDIYNLGKESVSGVVRFSGPPGFHCVPADISVELPAGKMMSVPIRLETPADVMPNAVMTRWTAELRDGLSSAAALQWRQEASH